MTQIVTGSASPAQHAAVPLFELDTQWQLIKNEVEAAVKQVLESQQYTSGATSGPFIGKFEEELGRTLGAHVIALSSGTDAILAALMALSIGHGDWVITTPFTFFATAGCIVRSGAKPLFVDIEPDTFLMSIPGAKAAIRGGVKAILPVHLYGQMLDTAALAKVASDARIDVIEDAAQAIGARDPHGRQIAENARCACLSFYPTKNLGAAGDAGALVTRDEKLAKRFAQTRQHGETTRYHHEFVGGNFRMDAIQAAVLTVKLRWLDRWNDRRRAIAAYYTKRFAGTDVVPPVEVKGAHHVYHQYVIRVSKRDQLRDYLGKQGVGCNIFYPRSLHLQECFADLGYRKGQFPVAEKACDEVLALPVFPELTDAQIERVADTILGFFH
jgi:dTDP-4-amino-4,6-dideoxygalactose transaminase